jgi:RNA polymerase sigma factor (sigma-70 family)
MTNRGPRSFFLLERLSNATPDEELVSRCLDGDEGAWSALVDKYKDLVWSVPLKYRLDPEDCADIFQSVWMDLFSELKGLRHVGALRSWLVTTAGHKCYHVKKRQQRLAPVVTGDTEWEPEDQTPSLVNLTLQSEKEQILREAVVGLPPRCQKLVKLLFFEHPPRPYDEIAKGLGLAVGSIGFIRGRCLKKLRELLSERSF